MCDYSVMAIANRLAVEGEELAAHRFASASIGLVAVTDLELWRGSQPIGAWSRFKSFFRPKADPSPIVCVPPGARLRLYNIPSCIRDWYSVKEQEEVVFTQISAAAGHYRDAVAFHNGRTMLLQHLQEAQRASVLWLPSERDRTQKEELATVVA